MRDNAGKATRSTRHTHRRDKIDELKVLVEQRPDGEIEHSGLPELTDAFFANTKRGAMLRLLKKQTTLRLDADILEWFKRHAKDGKGYQTDINKALRTYVVSQERKAAKKTG